MAAGGITGLPAIRDVVVEDIGAGVGMVAKILRCHIAYDGDADGCPETVIVKMPSPHRETFQTAVALRLYQREYAFYRRIAPHVTLRSPALLYGDFDESSHRFVLVLEDLRDMTAADQIAGASPAQAKAAIRAVAAMHGQFWDKVDRPPLSGFHDSANPERRPLVQAAYQAGLAPALERFGHLFPEPMRRLAAEYGKRIVGHLDEVAAGPRTLTHGDFRLDNMFFSADPDAGDGFAAVDWQVSGIASGLYDVAYFLSSSVAVAVRREIERDALAEYHDVIRSMGADDFTFAECWRSYRRNMLGCLMTPIVAGGRLDFGNDRSRRLAEVFLQRTLTAIDDLDAREFLPSA